MIVVRRNHWPWILLMLVPLTGVVMTDLSSGVEGVLREKDRERLQTELSDLSGQVHMVMFSQELECQYCAQTRELLAELDSMSDKLNLAVYDFIRHQEEVQRYGIDKIPATVLMSSEDVNIRYYGVPAGYELSALVETIKELSAGGPEISPEVAEKLKGLAQDIHIQVFVTPTCPYCPGAVRTAYRLAQAHPRIRADAVEAVEFPHLVNKYHVRGVPMVIINERVSFVGAQSDLYFAEKILEAAQAAGGQEEVEE